MFLSLSASIAKIANVPIFLLEEIISLLEYGCRINRGAEFLENLRVIPCQINKEFRVTSRILTKLGMFVVPAVLITHANF